jgi:hypothetical protein
MPGPPPNHSNRGDGFRVELAEWRRPTGRPLNATVTSSGQVLRHRYQADRISVGLAVKGSSAIVRRDLGQAVTGGLRFWRGRRLRGVLSAVVVDPGLRPRFFSVLPTPANFRSR